MTILFNSPGAKVIADCRDWSLVHMQAQDVPIRLARSIDELDQPGPGGSVQGLALTGTSGIVSLWWRGPLCAALPPDQTTGSIEVQIIQGVPIHA